MTKMNLSRRDALRTTLCGAGLIGLRSLATGIPMSILLDPRSARADDPCSNNAQFLILSTGGAGDPVNANAPGSYVPGVTHPPAFAAGTPISLGGTMTTAAQPWSTLPQAVLDRTSFFHHATLTNNHTDIAKVLALMGATVAGEQVPSVCSAALASCLGTLQKEPISVASHAPISFHGRYQATLTPTGIRDTLLTPAGPLTNLQKMRDTDLDSLHAILKQSRTAAEQAFLDQYVLSQQQVRAISQNLLDLLSRIKDDSETSSLLVAAILVKMKVSPVVAVYIDFGNDNHGDPGLAFETQKTQSGVASINALMQDLTMLGIQDQTTFAMMNVFGRTLASGQSGRNHYGDHHVTVMIGKNVKAGIVGGIDSSNARDPRASPIDSMSGAASQGGDISYTDTPASAGKTLGAVLGVPQSVLDANITSGKTVSAALA